MASRRRARTAPAKGASSPAFRPLRLPDRIVIGALRLPPLPEPSPVVREVLGRFSAEPQGLPILRLLT